MVLPTLPVTLTFLTLLALLSIAKAADNNSTTSGLILLNCGESTQDDDDGGRSWDGDTGSIFAPSMKGDAAIALGQPPSLTPRVPYTTARIFTSNYTYSFPVSPGRMFLRLYFLSTAYEYYAVSDAVFGVMARNLVLLNDFNALQTAQAITSAYLVREFSVNVSSGSLDLTFAPSAHQYGSYAFVNGIEIVPTPDVFATPDIRFVSGDNTSPFTFDADMSLQTMYRLNVGGPAISPKGDSGFYRSWANDAPYILGGFGLTFWKNDNLTISYTSRVPNYTAPVDVYGTARSMGPTAQINLNYNLTWILPVDAGFFYLLRFHFCEIKYPITKVNQRSFFIYINNQTAQEQMDVIFRSGGIGRPTYTEYVIMAIGSGQVDMWIALHPDLSSKPQYSDAILNGLEVFKLQNYGPSNLAGLNPPLPQKPDVNPNRLSSGERKTKGGIQATIGGTAGGFALLLIALFSMCVIYRRKKAAKSPGKTDYGHVKHPTKCIKSTCDLVRHFSFAKIQVATKDFDEALIIGRGGFGNVYIGDIDGGTKVAIKRCDQKSQQGFHEFQTEIEMLCNFRHRHLVSLIGYCEEKNEMILVYDYMAHGTLCEHLYNTRNPPLPWQQRLEICIGAARGLHYLHTGVEQGIIHRDVKTTNILLDDRLMAKVSDFGLSKASPDIGNTQMSTAVKGTFGYLDPEYFRQQRLTKKSDVYSFGVVLFETLCARPVINTELPYEQVSLRDWAVSCRKKGVLEEIVDPCVKEEITPECFRIFPEVAEKCVADRSIDRPSMGDVLWNLEVALQLQDSASYNTSCAEGASSLQISGVHSGKPSTNSTISVAAQEAIFSDIAHPEGR
ncbi:Receptor-like protein kinase FERONIA [Triticum urartu]|uniref:Receptor-like protein kinase FERONIA n=1 Tax=Triticum urartu TaxID=4572 RepID=M7ZB73_TRIUA|nr:receptor-like protein kinase FERONIA isoform X1 [Triticum urartu]XP_048561710.1 receptor-like protein kinase FERONIA isoform X1 [Triticum urartu]XP_048561711.1 receptor-like protein kinase FERONIA isoform X1 [Triticum urartu]EMS57312.1 Receptor-like protein kinase FERONIA [Triticum urartu]